MRGDYCFQCGQSGTDFDLPVGEFAKEFASEAFSLDSRLRLTLRPLFFKPGAVPRAFVAGHRARFVPPIRLYIFASFSMFLIIALGSGVKVANLELDLGTAATLEAPAGAEPVGPSAGSFRKRIEEQFEVGAQRIAEDPKSFSRLFMNRFAQAMFFLLPAFAVLLKLVHHRRLYVHHVVFSVYFHAFVFFVVSFAALPNAMGLSGLSDFTAIALIGVPPHLLLGMKRFYGESWVKTLAKLVFVSIAYAAVGAVTGLALLIVSVLMI
ncbi:MAG: DUF3667 domain-containing protein [Gemmatimonadetes bacterium]|nr:DUF3667 domain-containing protein [Gemmatimonadota bacterium]